MSTPLSEKVLQNLEAVLNYSYPKTSLSGSYITAENTANEMTGTVVADEETDIVVCNKNIMRVSSSLSPTTIYYPLIKGYYYVRSGKTYLLSFDTENTGVQCHINKASMGTGFGTILNLDTNLEDTNFYCDGTRKHFKVTGDGTVYVKPSSADFIARTSETSTTATGHITNVMLEEVDEEATECSDYIKHQEQNYTGTNIDIKTYDDITHIYNTSNVNMTAEVRERRN